MTHSRTALLGLLLTGAATGAVAGAYRDVPGELLRHARVSERSALAAARHAVPGGAVAAIELERDNGVLLYLIDLQLPGSGGLDELSIDARSGVVLGSRRTTAPAK